MTAPQDAVEAIREVSGALKGVREDIRGLRRYGRKNRKLVLLDIAATAISIISVAVALHANSSATQAQRRADRAYARIVAAHESQLSGCRTGNQLRREQVQFWEYLATLSLNKPAPHLTEKQIAKNKRDVAAILAHARKSFPQLDCARIYRLPRGG